MTSTTPTIIASIRDSINFVCPHVAAHRKKFGAWYGEYLDIYMVSGESYKRCQLGLDAKFVGQCRTPYRPSLITLVFREFTPKPNGLEFVPGQIYYFISKNFYFFKFLLKFLKFFILSDLFWNFYGPKRSRRGSL